MYEERVSIELTVQGCSSEVKKKTKKDGVLLFFFKVCMSFGKIGTGSFE